MPPRDKTKRRIVPTQERAQASIEAILTAAEMLLRERGFAGLTTNRVAVRAGVNVALVYRYFAGKEALVAALIERVASLTHDAVCQVLAEQAQAPLSVAIRALLDVLVTTPGAPALHRELVEHVDIAKRRPHVDALRSRIAQSFTDFLAQRRTELRPMSDAEASLFVLQHAIEAATHAAAFYRPPELSLARVLDATTELVMLSLTAPEVSCLATPDAQIDASTRA